MSPADRLGLTTLVELRSRVCARYFQQPVTRPIASARLNGHEGFRYQTRYDLGQLSRIGASFACNRLGVTQREGPHEDRQPAQNRALLLLEKVATPIQQRAQGLMSGLRRSPALPEQLEAEIQQLRSSTNTMCSDAAGSQFQG